MDELQQNANTENQQPSQTPVANPQLINGAPSVQPPVISPPLINQLQANEPKKFSKLLLVLVIVIVLIALAGVLILVEGNSSKSPRTNTASAGQSSELSTQTLSNNGYTYSFQFFNDAKSAPAFAADLPPSLYSATTDLGTTAYPVTGGRECFASGGIAVAFEVTVQSSGIQTPVCSAAPVNGVVFAYSMTTQNSTGQWFTEEVINAKGQDITKYESVLKDTFSSFTVK